MNNDNYKKWFIGLAGGFVVIAGVLTSSFYVSYEKVKGELAQTSGELLNAQSQVEDLTKELEESSLARWIFTTARRMSWWQNGSRMQISLWQTKVR